MGLLSLGTSLPWIESRHLNEHVKDNGVEQLLYIFKNTYNRDGDILLWGDEVEYMICEFDHLNKNVMVSLDHDDAIISLNTEDLSLCNAQNVHFHPEYGRYMIEATPATPYNQFNGSNVEFNMKKRRDLLYAKLSSYNNKNSIIPLSLTVFPRLGCPQFLNVEDPWVHKNPASRSLFLPDTIINRHVRFPTLTANIRERRGEKVCINIPMYQDINTPKIDDTVYHRAWFIPEDLESLKASKPGYIYMDSMGFGMGCSCLQLTFQTPNITKSRYLYDVLTTFAPIMLSITAASPVFKGWIANQDVRWNVIAGSVDDRTPFERDVNPLLSKYNNGFGGVSEDNYNFIQKVPKSRYSAVDVYLGGNDFFNCKFNNTNVPINKAVLKKLKSNEIFKMDHDLAVHFAHLYIRDPIVIFEEQIYQDNEHSTDHFENIQSTNWQTIRFKPPSQDATPENNLVPGWRVEFRPMEVQLTDFENAAYSIFMYLIVECLLTFGDDINPYIPMSQVWENMRIAHNRDSVISDTFYWKNNFYSESDSQLSSIYEIFHNSENGLFKQFINRILRHKRLVLKDWEELVESTNRESVRLYYYLKLISYRASGKLPTIAKFMREFIFNHPSYKQDSRVTKEINYDLLQLSARLSNLDDVNGEVTRLFGIEISQYILNNKL